MMLLGNSLFQGLELPAARVPLNTGSGLHGHGNDDQSSTPPQEFSFDDPNFHTGLATLPDLPGTYTPQNTWMGQTSSDLVRERVALMKLATSHSMDLHIFAEDPPAKQMIKMYAQQLLNTPLLEELRGAATWTPSEELMTAIDKYCTAFVLSSRTAAYKGIGGTAPTCVINILVASRISDLPSTKDLGRMTKVRSIVSNRLTSHRAVLKAKIKSFLPKLDLAAGEEEQNVANDVATLTAAMVQGTGVFVTMELRERAMLLRHFMNNDDSPDDQCFWDRVDVRLAELRALSQAEKLVLKRAIQAQEDKNYGPANTAYPIALVSELDPWQRLVEDHSEKAADQVTHAARRRKPAAEKENNAANTKKRRYNPTATTTTTKATPRAGNDQAVGGDATNVGRSSSPSLY